ncbi:MAG TPA: glutamate--tRNA ligase [Candidatus Paceibacterota bacterium]
MFNWFKPKVRVRIAPSPTGFLHIGTARTALFNYLFAKHQGGTFILRIEDTDLERSEKRFETDIIQGLQWLGIIWNEGPDKNSGYRQSERLAIYRKYLQQLLTEQKAYYCACAKEELEQERKLQEAQKQPLRYSGKCRDRNIPAEQGHVIRFKIPEQKISFTDMIRGEISFETNLFGDLAIAKNLDTPLYNFAVVIDDQEMKISHVIRGEDHIANTPKQIALQEALGFKIPQYAHLPLILDPDRSKMSKRFSAVSIEEYKKQGYLPEALFNFIALLGWHPQDDQEILSPEKLIKMFDISRVQKAGAVFDMEKLKWMNQRYIQQLSNEELKIRLQPYISDTTKKSPILEKIISLTKERLTLLSEFESINDLFFQLPEYETSLLIWKQTPKENILENLRKNSEFLKNISMQEFNKIGLERTIMPFAETNGRGEVLWPLRVALSGKDKSPGPFEIMDIIGKDETLRRVEIAIKKLEGYH